jgi:hypothetical protein
MRQYGVSSRLSRHRRRDSPAMTWPAIRPGMFAPATRPRAPLQLVAGFAALSAIAGVFFVISAPEAKRDAHVTGLVRSACEHRRLNHVALERLVRVNRDAAIDQDHAVKAIVAYCLASR